MNNTSEKLNNKCGLCGSIFYKKKNESKRSWSIRKYCSRKCTNNAKVGVPSKKKGKKLNYDVWNKGKKGLQVAWNKGLHYELNERHSLWKGDNASLEAKHEWVKRRLGKPQRCEHCGTTENRMYHWANISGEYKRDLKDWKRLCVPCHKKFDLLKNNVL